MATTMVVFVPVLSVVQFDCTVFLRQSENFFTNNTTQLSELNLKQPVHKFSINMFQLGTINTLGTKDCFISLKRKDVLKKYC